jgi:hypothetical protein
VDKQKRPQRLGERRAEAVLAHVRVSSRRQHNSGTLPLVPEIPAGPFLQAGARFLLRAEAVAPRPSPKGSNSHPATGLTCSDEP